MTTHLFIPCLVEQCLPETGEAMARVLARQGCRVELPSGQTCCGQPLYKTGDWTEARRAALYWLDVFEALDGHIVSPSASCVATVRKGYPRIFADDSAALARVATVSAHLFEFTEYLVDVLGVTDTGASLQASAVYHESCQTARALGLRRQPRALLDAVDGLALLPLHGQDECCGFGGTFSFDNPTVSDALLADKLDAVEASGAEAVITAEPSCLLNIRGGLEKRGSRVKTLHIAEVLDSVEEARHNG